MTFENDILPVLKTINMDAKNAMFSISVKIFPVKNENLQQLYKYA